MFTFYFFSAFLQTRNVKSPSNRPKRKTHTLLILISLTLNYNRLIILIDWNKSASARINKMKCLELLQKTEKRVSDNKNTCCWRALLKMHIDSLPAGGAFGAAENSGFPGNCCTQSSAPLMNAVLSDKMKMPLNIFWRQAVPFKDKFI